MLTRWGIVGAGTIVREEMGRALIAPESSVVSAVTSRRLESAKAVADRLGGVDIEPSLNTLLERDDVDAVYLAVPNHLHAPYILRCLEAGKHVLCEKPLALSVKEVERIELASQAAQRKVVEGLMWRAYERVHAARRLVQQGVIGEPVWISVRYVAPGAADNPRNDPSQGGGAHRDLGTYCVDALQFFMPETLAMRLSCAAHTSSTGLVIRWAAHFSSHRSERTASIFTAMDCRRESELVIVGTDGSMRIPTPFRIRTGDPTPVILIHDAMGTRQIRFRHEDPYSRQVELFIAHLTGGPPLVSLLESKRIVSVIDDVS